MLVLGLTGSIGMGKSTTATLFGAAGVPVHDADATVHKLYRGRAAPLIEARFPGSTNSGVVQRDRLAAAVLGRPAEIEALEAIVHPLVREEEIAFLTAARARAARLVVLDIPLLFETGAEARVDAILVVTAPDSVQKARVLARPGMTADKFAAILARQIPDKEKRRRSHALIDTSFGLDAARRDVEALLRALAGHPGRRLVGPAVTSG
ncbi:MAG TPA: dephospho-CoA kinase [Beijerinckiaceae bacterium]|nr:dephospho-CoA kinase [Beijerinckiaceae bacterium]